MRNLGLGWLEGRQSARVSPIPPSASVLLTSMDILLTVKTLSKAVIDTCVLPHNMGASLMTDRQKKYRIYLQSEHWSNLRAEAIARDGGKCVRCGASDWVQVHHVNYRSPLTSCVLDDVETLCRKCHRLEHGFGPTDFESKYREIERCFGYLKRPSPADWKTVRALIRSEEEVAAFGDLMFRYILFVRAHELERSVPNWWLAVPGRRDFWFERAKPGQGINQRKGVRLCTGSILNQCTRARCMAPDWPCSRCGVM